jgi:hypothetical protein
MSTATVPSCGVPITAKAGSLALKLAAGTLDQPTERAVLPYHC